MRRALILSVPLAVLALSPCSAAQQPPPVQRDPQAVAILAQSMAAMGSMSLPRDSVARGTITLADGRSGTIMLKSKGADRLRHEVSLDGKDSVMVAGGSKGHVSPGTETRNLPHWVTMYLRPQHLYAHFRLAESSKPGAKLIYVGQENVNGQPAHHIRISNVSADAKQADIEEIISECHVFIDAQTSLVVKTITYDFSPLLVQNRTPVETYLSDYRAVSGILVPHRMTRYIWGNKDSEIVLNSVQVNVGLPESDFQ